MEERVRDRIFNIGVYNNMVKRELKLTTVFCEEALNISSSASNFYSNSITSKDFYLTDDNLEKNLYI